VISISTQTLTRVMFMTATLLLASSCQSSRKKTAPPPELVKEQWKYPGEWTGGNKPITRMIVNVDVQRAVLYNNNDIVGWTYFASGIPSFPTPTGDFKILEKIKDKVSNLYGKGFDKNGKLVNSDFKQGRDLLPEGGQFQAAKMPYFMRLTGDGVGMHIGPIPRPGRRASHGCIRLPSKMAPILFEHTVVGTSVTVTGNGPDYQTYLKQSAEKAKANSSKLSASKRKAQEAAAAATSATTLAPDDPNGPLGGVTTPPPGAPPGTPASPPVEVKPAQPASPPTASN
jgi:hypothetical protein